MHVRMTEEKVRFYDDISWLGNVNSLVNSRVHNILKKILKKKKSKPPPHTEREAYSPKKQMYSSLE